MGGSKSVNWSGMGEGWVETGDRTALELEGFVPKLANSVREVTALDGQHTLIPGG